MSYGIRVAIVNDDDMEIAHEIVGVSYEQGAEAVARLVRFYKKKQAEAERRAEDED